MKEYVLVPQDDINTLERARKELHTLFSSLNVSSALLLPITEPMWKLTHTRYKVATDYQEPDPSK